MELSKVGRGYMVKEMKEAGADVRYNACGPEMVCKKSNNKVSMFGNAS